MSYSIEALSITSFLDEGNLKLPRFQRKATWKSKQSFELAISVFQDYPVGVVIVNKEKDQSWLLDGRQRRTALKGMRENPVELYFWAKSYLGFKATEDEGDIRSLYWAKVDKYLQTEPANDENLYSEEDEDISTTSSEDNSFDSERQREGLRVLLDLILMVHQVKRGISRWEKTFDFRQYLSVLRYAPRKYQYEIQPTLLRKWILDVAKDLDSDGGLSADAFAEYCIGDCRLLQDEMEASFRTAINDNWPNIESSIRTIQKAEKIFVEARIGVINLTKATPLDAQNIFSRINAGGTQLTAEELLSAKPYWNGIVSSVDRTVDKEVDLLYRGLGLDKPETIVRWDIAATLLARIDSTYLVFPRFPSDEFSVKKVSLGFKLLSSMITGGMSAKNVISLESRDDIDWDADIEQYVHEVNQVIEVLLATSYFKFLNAWNKSVTDLLGNAIALEFITICWLDWKDKGRPTASSGSANLHSVQRDARILFDRLVYEYATRQWRGSGDSRMAKDIKDWKLRLTPIERSDWEAFVENASKGQHNGQQTNITVLTPAIYYYYVLNSQGPGNAINVSFEVDHIIPKEKFSDNSTVELQMRDSLCNLALLPKKDNISKRNKLLNELSDPWLISQISQYTGISEDKFASYSSVSKVTELAEERIDYYLEAFGDTRDAILSN